MAPPLPLFTVDVFTDKTFSGNPAAVCPLDEALSDEMCQKIAFEMNLSETAFVTQISGNFVNGNRFGLRWFTPKEEVSLCGHATLATAHVLFKHFNNIHPVITFETLSGELHCSKSDDGGIRLDFPIWNVKQLEEADKDFFAPLVKECVGSLPVNALWFVDGKKKLIVVLDDKIDRYVFESLKPDISRMNAFDPSGEHVVGVSMTMKGSVSNGCVDENGKTFDFVSRHFAPWVGVPEDPVTGSIHCALAMYWSSALGGQRFYARQCSQRGGVLNLELRNDGRIFICGKATTVITGHIEL